MQPETITYMPYEALATAVVVVLALCGVIITIGKTADVVRGWKKPKAQEDQALRLRQAECDRHFSADLQRIKALEVATAKQQETDRVVLTALRAILSHEINGNSIDRMKEAYDALDKMLINR